MKKSNPFILVWRCVWTLAAGPITAFHIFPRTTGQLSSKTSGGPFGPLGVMLAALVYYATLFFLPLHWSFILGIHVLACTATALFRYRGVETSCAGLPQSASSSWQNCLAMTGVGLLPVIFLAATAWHAKDFIMQPAQMPSSVFLRGFQWMALLSPAVVLIAVFLTKRQYRFEPRHVFLFYVSGFTVTAAFLGSHYLFHQILEQSAVSADHPLYFSYYTEYRFRHWIKIILLCAGLLPLVVNQVAACGGSDFVRRSVFTLFACIPIVFNCALVSGESNYLITGLEKWAFKYHHFGLFKAMVTIQTARTPHYFLMPNILEKLAELEYQQGNKIVARQYFQGVVARYGNWSSHKRTIDRVRRMLDHWDAMPENGDGNSVSLDVPVVDNADYLTMDWYGVLSAVAYRNPGLTDLELKEKLLNIFSLEDHQLPLIESMPSLIGALNRLRVSHRAAFLDTGRLLAALRQRYVPLVFFNYSWIPIVGYDALRNGFYYYEYSSNFKKGPSLSSAGDTRLIFDGGREMGDPAKQKWKKFTYQRFLSSRELSQHIRNIGGVGLIICDSTFIPQSESRAAYLIELGDFYYQEKNNFSRAARCYTQSRRLSANWVVLERMAFLKRYYRQQRLNRQGVASLFTPSASPPWEDSPWLGDSLWNVLDQRVRAGKAGWYILERWPLKKPGRDTALVRELIEVYGLLHEENPYSTDYLDSLARLNGELGLFHRSGAYYESLLSMFAGGNSHVALRLAWIKLLNNKIPELKKLLRLCSSEDNRARYLTLKAACLLHQGKVHRALKRLELSLKEDKTLAETHRLAALCHTRLGNDDMRHHHEIWTRRCQAEPVF